MNRTQFSLACGMATILAGSPAWAGAPHSNLKARAETTEPEAQQTALAVVPGGSIKDGEVEEENGKLIWSFDIARPQASSITEIQVDAVTGKVVFTMVESLKDQVAEVKEDRTEGAKMPLSKVQSPRNRARNAL